MPSRPFWQRILTLGLLALLVGAIMPAAALATTNCPVSSDSTASTLPNPGPNDPTTSGSNLAHHQQHDNENDAIRCIEAYMGFNASQTSPTAANAVLNSTSSTASTWSTTPTLGTIALQQNPASGAATTVASNGTIATALGVQRVTSAGNITGVILTAGTLAGQVVHVLNTSTHTMTFDAAGTSNVSGGTGVAIAAGQDMAFVWASVEALWFPVGPIPLVGAGVTTAATLTSGNCVVGAGASTIGIQASGYGFTCSSAAVGLTTATNSLAGDVTLNSPTTFFDGPSTSQGSTGTWCGQGTVTLVDSAVGARFTVKLWDGTTVIASADTFSNGANQRTVASLSGCLAAPGGNIRISVEDASATTGLIKFNASGSSKDSTLTVWRVS